MANTVKIHPDIIEQISKVKNPFFYYIYAIRIFFLYLLYSIAFLSVVGFLLFWAYDNGWFDYFIKHTVISLIVFGVPILGGISMVALVVVEIWKGFERKTTNWKCFNYSHTHSYSRNCVKIFRDEKESIVNRFYDNWIHIVKNCDAVPKLNLIWRQSFIELSINVVLPNNGVIEKELSIPLFFRDGYYSNPDYSQCISQLNYEDGNDLVKDIVHPININEQDIINLISDSFRECKVSRINRDGFCYQAITRDRLNTIIILERYTSKSDITDILTSDTLEQLIPTKTISIVAFQKEISQEEFIKECVFRKRKKQFEEQLPQIQFKLHQWNRNICGYPYHYFYDYCTNAAINELRNTQRGAGLDRMRDISNSIMEAESVRNMIFNFKDSTPDKRYVSTSSFGSPIPGRFQTLFFSERNIYKEAFDKVVALVSEKISNTFGCDAASQVAFVCVPASSPKITENRLKDFYHSVCEKTGMDNAYPFVTQVEGDSPKHLGGQGVISINLDKYYFSGKKVVVFDDIITRGKTMQKMVNALTECGAEILFIISIARTTNEG